MILIFILAALSASTYTFGKALMSYTSPIFLIGVRLLTAGVIFLSVYYVNHKKWPRLLSKDYWLLAQVSLFSFYIGFVAEFWALKYMSSAKTAFLCSLSPIATGILSYFVFHEKMTWRKIIGLAISLGGISLTLMAHGQAEGRELLWISLPEFVLIISVVSFSYGWIVLRKGLHRHALPSSFIKGIGMLMGGAGALLTAYFFEKPVANTVVAWWFPVTNIVSFVWLATLLIFIGNILCYLLYVYLFKHYTATIVTFGELTIPFFATLYGKFFLNEAISSTFLPSMLLLLLGMFIFYQEEKRLGYYS